MKYLIILLIFLVSCKPNAYKHSYTNLDNSLNELRRSIDTLGKNMDLTHRKIEIINKGIEYKSKRDQCEIKYLRTGNEKYRTLGNRYVDSIHLYSIKFSELK